MKRAELQVGGAYRHKSGQYGSSQVVIVLSDQPYVENGWSRTRTERFRPAQPHQKGRKWGQDSRSGVLVATTYLPYGGYVNASVPWNSSGLHWSLDVVQLSAIHEELCPPDGDFDATMRARANRSLEAHRARIKADEDRRTAHATEEQRCKDAIEGAGYEVGYAPSPGVATAEVKYGKGRITLSIEDFEVLTHWAGIGAVSNESEETRLSR